MSKDQFIQHVQTIHSQIAALHRQIMQLPQAQEQEEKVAEVMDAIAASLDNLQLIHEQMQTLLEARDVVEEQLIKYNESLVAKHQLYYDLFQFAPDGYLLTDSNGLILEANQAAATLLNVLQKYLIGKPLAIFVPQKERQVFRIQLNQLSQLNQVQDWEIFMCPRDGEPFVAHLTVAPVRDSSGNLVSLRTCIRDVSKYKQIVAKPLQLLESERYVPVETQTETNDVASSAVPLVLPRSLDGLQVLIVDDEADVREFITAVLEAHGIRVTAVSTAAEALETLERFRPDVLVSDIRMPGENGYSLIRKVRELETLKGWHIPATAFTAYVAEDREKALRAGFESHLHKLASPEELVETVTRLAGQSRNSLEH